MIHRPQFTLSSLGIPILPRWRLEAFSTEILSRYFPDHLKSPKPLAAVQMLQLLREQDSVSFDFVSLGDSDGRKRLGRLYPRRALIHFDESLLKERSTSLPFVAAHEMSHWLLHRDCDISKLKLADAFPEDDDKTEAFLPNRKTRSPLDWLEWQANTLAGALLIPHQMAAVRIFQIHSEEYPTRRQPDIIYQNASDLGVREANAKLGLLAHSFGVSKTVARIRLRLTGLLKEQERELTKR